MDCCSEFSRDSENSAKLIAGFGVKAPASIIPGELCIGSAGLKGDAFVSPLFLER
jgi:hypothetical protein